MPIRQFSLFLSACGMLGACGGGEGGGGEAGAASPGPMEYAVRDAAFESLTSRLEDAEITATLPVSGTATYVGYLGAAAELPGGSLFFTGDAEVTARFAARTVSGRLDRFLGPGGAEIPGSAVIVDGRIGPSGITAAVEGHLAAAGERHAIDGAFSGTFLGASARSAAGVVDATLSSGGSGTGTLTGELWLER